MNYLNLHFIILPILIVFSYACDFNRIFRFEWLEFEYVLFAPLLLLITLIKRDILFQYACLTSIYLSLFLILCVFPCRLFVRSRANGLDLICFSCWRVMFLNGCCIGVSGSTKKAFHVQHIVSIFWCTHVIRLKCIFICSLAFIHVISRLNWYALWI